MEKEPRMLDVVIQLDPETGVSHDYVNQYSALVGYASFGADRFMAMVRKMLLRQGKVLLRYEEHFPPTKFADVVNDKNRDSVIRINAIVDDVNRLATITFATNAEGMQHYMEKFRELEVTIRGARPTW